MSHICHNTTKPTMWHVPPAKTQISLGISLVYSESLLSIWRQVRPLITFYWPPDNTLIRLGLLYEAQLPLCWVCCSQLIYCASCSVKMVETLVSMEKNSTSKQHILARLERHDSHNHFVRILDHTTLQAFVTVSLVWDSASITTTE